MACSTHGTGDKCIQSFIPWNILWEENNLGDLDINRRIIFKWILLKYGVTMWVGFLRLRIGASSRLL